MTTDPTADAPPAEAAGTSLPDAARRALAEAAARRNTAGASPPAPETGGRGGPDPVRYGDWERNGIASDF